MDTSSVDLPDELIGLILSKCPVKSVLRFKSVSKSWQSIISDPRFLKIHHMHHIQRSKLPENQSKFLLCASPEDSQEDQVYLIILEDGKVIRESWSGHPPEEFIWPLCSCNGLILLRKRPGKEYALWNPFIRKHIIISQEYTKSHMPWNGSHSHLYYDSVSEDYKIVYVYGDWYAVYSCKSESWGEKQDFPRDRIRCSEASVDGYIYGMKGGGGITIMCFDVREGKLHEFPGPEGAECPDLVRLDTVSGRLCFYGFNKNGGGHQLWVMDKNECWKKLIKQGILPDRLHHPICLSNEDDVVLMSGGKHFIYNSRQKSLQEANFTWEISQYYFPYQENLYLP